MKRGTFFSLILLTTAVCILFPVGVILLWSFTGRWPWPSLLPESYILRTWKELFFGSASLPKLLFSSMTLAATVALLGTLIGILTARATEFYQIPCKTLIRFGTLLPLLIPSTVFTMGIQVVLIRLRMTDTIAGIILVHLVAAMPYCITIMTDMTVAIGSKLEEQAAVLGAPPLRAFFYGSFHPLLPGILSSMSMGFILSYSQYFTTLLVGGGRIRTIATVLVPYIQSGDRPLASAYSAAFVASALAVFALFEWLIHRLQKGGLS